MRSVLQTAAVLGQLAVIACATPASTGNTKRNPLGFSLPPLIPSIPGVTEPLASNAIPLPVLQIPTPPLNSPPFTASDIKPKKIGYFWTGAGDNLHKDFLATVSLDDVCEFAPYQTCLSLTGARRTPSALSSTSQTFRPAATRLIILAPPLTEKRWSAVASCPCSRLRTLHFTSMYAYSLQTMAEGTMLTIISRSPTPIVPSSATATEVSSAPLWMRSVPSRRGTIH